MRLLVSTLFWGFSGYVFVIRSVASKLATGFIPGVGALSNATPHEDQLRGHRMDEGG